MKNLVIVLGLIVSLFIAGSAFADPSGEDMLHVVCHIDPNIAVDAGEDVRIAALQTGDVAGDLPFRVDANTQWITVTVYASDLYKGNDPFSTYVIPVNVSAGTSISVVGGNPVPYFTPLTSAVDVYAGFMGYMSDPVDIENGDNGHFSQDLSVRVTWTNDDDEMPVGDYSGWVKLLGAVLPNGPESGDTTE